MNTLNLIYRSGVALFGAVTILSLTACTTVEECDDSTATDDSEVTDDTTDTEDTGEADPCADAAAGTWTYDNLDCWVDYAQPGSCGGDAQSPIDVTGATADAGLPAAGFVPSNSVPHVENNGNVLAVHLDPGTFFSWGTLEGGWSREATLRTIEVHTPAEHTIGGAAAAPMELQFIHQDIWQDRMIVVSVLVTEGTANDTLGLLTDNLPATAGGTWNGAESNFNAYSLMPASKAYATYEGSETRPPCAETVTWLVMNDPIQASTEQIAAFTAIYADNARPVQDLNGRTVKQKAD